MKVIKVHKFNCDLLDHLSMDVYELETKGWIIVQHPNRYESNGSKLMEFDAANEAVTFIINYITDNLSRRFYDPPNKEDFYTLLELVSRSIKVNQDESEIKSVNCDNLDLSESDEVAFAFDE